MCRPADLVYRCCKLPLIFLPPCVSTEDSSLVIMRLVPIGQLLPCGWQLPPFKGNGITVAQQPCNPLPKQLCVSARHHLSSMFKRGGALGATDAPFRTYLVPAVPPLHIRRRHHSATASASASTDKLGCLAARVLTTE